MEVVNFFLKTYNKMPLQLFEEGVKFSPLELCYFAEEYVKQQLHKTAVMPSLLLAGKLALAARLVTIANAKNLSKRIEEMETVLDAYDNEIMSLSNEYYTMDMDVQKI